MIRSFIFDIGNVLLPFDFNRALQRIQARTRIPLLQLATAYQPLQNAYESGQIDLAQFVERSIALMEFEGTHAEFVSAWAAIFEENPAMFRLVKRLQGRYPLYLLSNTNDIHLNYFTAQYPVFGSFSDAVYSHRVGCMKPARTIYEIAARQFGVEPHETVFIDDLPANIAAAREFGFHAIQYDHRQHQQLLDALAALGVKDLAD